MTFHLKFALEYYVKKERWQPILNDDSLHCEEKKGDGYDKHAFAIIYDSFHLEKVLGHIRFYWSELVNKFLKFPNHYIRVIVTGKRVNRGVGLALEIPDDYFFRGDNRVIEWFKKSIEKLDKYTNAKVEKYMK